MHENTSSFSPWIRKIGMGQLMTGETEHGREDWANVQTYTNSRRSNRSSSNVKHQLRRPIDVYLLDNCSCQPFSFIISFVKYHFLSSLIFKVYFNNDNNIGTEVCRNGSEKELEFWSVASLPHFYHNHNVTISLLQLH